MIDTVVLEIPRSQFTILRPESFEPDCTRMLDSNAYLGRAFVKAIKNPTAQDVEENNYKPRLTLINRLKNGAREITLKVEFSASKMIFGNNFDELQDDDFSKLAQVLANKLFEMGVSVKSYDVYSFPITTIHFSKNIPLTDYVSSSMIINQLHKVDLTRRLDLDRTSFRNGGHCLHFHANSFEIVFYDKVKDLEQSKISPKRAIENNDWHQTHIFDLIEEIKPLEVLRMEVRLCKRKKIKAVLKDLSIDVDVVFGSLFKKAIARKILLYFWDYLDGGLSAFAMDSRSPIDLLEGIKKHAPNLKPQKMLQLVGSILLMQEVGVVRLRDSLGLVGSARHIWPRLKKDLLSVNKMTQGDNYKSVLAIPKALRDFTPLKLANFSINL